MSCATASTNFSPKDWRFQDLRVGQHGSHQGMIVRKDHLDASSVSSTTRRFRTPNCLMAKLIYVPVPTATTAASLSSSNYPASLAWRFAPLLVIHGLLFQ